MKLIVVSQSRQTHTKGSIGSSERSYHTSVVQRPHLSSSSVLSQINLSGIRSLNYVLLFWIFESKNFCGLPSVECLILIETN